MKVYFVFCYLVIFLCCFASLVNSLLTSSTHFVTGSRMFLQRALRQASSQKILRQTPQVLRMSASSLPTDENGWRTVLSPAQFKVLRQKGTEAPGFSERTPGELEFELKKEQGTKYPKQGAFNCVACNTPLYEATSKFDSGCGWPAFYQGIPGKIREVPDADGRRVEILCNNCGSHLGHVFKGEGFPTPTNERHCVNGICLKYEPTK